MKMNNFLTMSAIALMITGFGVYRANAATDQLDTDAVIVVAMTVACGTALNFGDIAADTTGGTVTVDAAGSRTTGGPVLLGGTVSAGACAVTGDGNRAYTITLAPDPLVGPGTPVTDMALSAFAVDSLNSGPFTGLGPHTAALATGADTLAIGATLTLAANQTAGAYSGTVDVTVNYQ